MKQNHNHKPTQQAQQTTHSSSDDKSCGKRIHLTLVTEEEREKYRVPSYGYLLP